MAINDLFTDHENDLADNGSFIVTGASAETDSVEIFEMGGSGASEVYREIDVDDDGTYEVQNQINAPSESWHSQQNGIVVSDLANVRVRIVNTSGGPADFFAVGMEVDN